MAKFSEADVKTKLITPAIKKAGWDINSQMREEVTFTAGRIIVRGKMTARGKTKRADYILYYKPNIPLAIVEAKDNTHTIGSGMQQALEYSEMLDIPFIFSSNGEGFLFHDKSGTSENLETELSLENFPSPDELWQKYKAMKGLSETGAVIAAQDYFDDGSGRTPRYYQSIAINRTIEAIARGQNKIILVMATGTGKTYTAFQIIWRLWKAKKKKRILFLADRNILVDQTKQQDFAPFGDKMTKIQNRTVDKSYEIYLSLYQAVTGTEESQNIYKQYSPDFFDLIVIDECHRGSASEASAWRQILNYFSTATHIGLTATPKETDDVSNIEYFGDPVYSYSLKQGISDGFLAPYKVIRIDFDKDLEGYRPEKGKVDKYGNLIDDRIYNTKDFDRNLVLEKRTEEVAKKVTEFLSETSPYDKTIIFCEDIDHAERMRQAIANANPERMAENHRYVMRITGDNPEGKAELDNFINPESRYPVIATTSKLMTTGVDAKTCKLIVLDQTIKSMTEFKQIIGRGTRVLEEHGKKYFTIMDFKKATELFADPDFDGDPVQVYSPADEDSITPDDESTTEGTIDIDGEEVPVTDITWDEDEDDSDPKKFYINDVEVDVLSKRVQYLDADGNLITESLKDYSRKGITKEYKTLDDFLRRWNEADKKTAIVKELEEQGVPVEALREIVKNGDAYGGFDLICHVAYGQPPLTRKERADNVKKRDYFTKYEAKARAVLEALLDKYADEGLTTLEDNKILTMQPFPDIGTPIEIIKNIFGGKVKYGSAISDLETEIFKQDQSA